MQDVDEKNHHPYDRRTRGQKLADDLATVAGSWGFIITFLAVIVFWVLLNGYLLATRPWDPYPFILLNLGLSMLAALQAPVILMSQNRAAQRDRRKAEIDLAINKKAEREIEDIQKDLQEIKRLLKKE